MKKGLMLLIAVLVLAVAVWAANVTCPLHYNAPCYNTGQIRSVNGRFFELYHCTCGDEYWVAQ